MRKNKIISVLMLTVALLLSGCSWLSLDTTGAGRIVPPSHTLCPLAGNWVVADDFTVARPYLPLQGTKEDYLGAVFRFSNDMAAMNDTLWPDPNYKVKIVNSAQYMLSKYLELPEDILPTGDEVSVVTVSTADNFIGEFMKLNDDELIGLFQNRVLYLKRANGEVKFAGGEIPQSADEGSPKKDYMNSSGVLIGLKTPVYERGEISGYRYRTLWVAADRQVLLPILEGQGLFFPRLSGFWEVKSVTVREGDRQEERLLAYDLSTKERELVQLDPGFWQGRTGHLAREIVYLGTDYIVLEVKGEGTREAADLAGASAGGEGMANVWRLQRYMVLSLDNIAAAKGIKVADLLGEKGFAAWQDARNQALKALPAGISQIVEEGAEENFGVVRELGRWFLKGRVNYVQDGRLMFLDFDLNYIPPSSLVSYDVLYVPWQNIKERVPEAIDAYNSPNRDLAIVLTKNELLVFAIQENQLAGGPLAKVKLNDEETVIMAEWATGSFVRDWEQSFRLYKSPVQLTAAVEF